MQVRSKAKPGTRCEFGKRDRYFVTRGGEYLSHDPFHGPSSVTSVCSAVTSELSHEEDCHVVLLQEVSVHISTFAILGHTNIAISSVAFTSFSTGFCTR
jgi:hypothetical protein